MAQRARIRTPLGTHWRRIRFQLMPMAAFAGIVYLTAWLWGRQYVQPDTIGEVLADRRDVTSLVDGRLAKLPQWFLNDRVEPDQVVARLDSEPFRLELEQLQRELEGLKAQAEAAKAELLAQALDARSDRLSEVRQLAVDIESLKLQIVQRDAELKADQVELQLRDQLLTDIKSAADTNPGAVTAQELLRARIDRQVVDERIAGHKQFLAEARVQLQEKNDRFEAYRDQVDSVYSDQIAVRLLPLQHAIEAKNTQIEAIDYQIGSLEIQSTIAGKIAAIYRYPGERVAAHEPILTIAADRSDRVISYVRQNQRITPEDDMPVLVRLRTSPNRSMEGQIVSVGAQVEPIPAHQLMDPAKPEWGLPVVIQIPYDANVRPGELVDVSLGRP